MKRAWVAAAVVALLASCGGSKGGPPDGSPAGVRPSSVATIRIVEPRSGALVRGTSVEVAVEVEGGRVVPTASTKLTPDTGHVHLSLDGKIVTLLAGLRYVVEDLTPGEHLLEAEFAAADHGPFSPRVVTTVTFTVR